MSKRIFFTSLLFGLIWLCQPAMHAQTEASTYTFRFVAGKDMFYSPYADNEQELARLLDCIEQHRDSIVGGKLPLHVDGYCSSRRGKKSNMAVAAIRSNRVKSELILRCGVTEDCFITSNHSYGGDYVTVSVTILSETPQPAVKEERIEEETQAIEEPTTTKQDELQPEATEIEASTATTTDIATHLSLRANLVRWATLTPDLGLEWHVSQSWSILAHGSWTSWSWSDKDRRYALWEVAPEVRYHMGGDKRGYVGVMYKAGQFNYKLSDTGRQGDLMGGGITGGYRLRLNNCLSLDFSLAVGYLRADTEKYVTIDGVRVAQGKEKKNWWGPMNAGVTLVWTIF